MSKFDIRKSGSTAVSQTVEIQFHSLAKPIDLEKLRLFLNEAIYASEVGGPDNIRLINTDWFFEEREDE